MRYAIVGNGMAAVSAAVGLREKSPDADIVLYTDEPYPYYSRPGLMYHMMGIEKEWDLYCDRPNLYDRNRLQLVFAKVEQVSENSLALEGGESHSFDKLLLAVGAAPRKLGCPGEDLSGVHCFTLLSDAKAMMSAAKPGMKGVVIGGGLLGAEISEVWRRLGMDVTLLVLEDWYFKKSLSEEQGRAVERGFRKHGVDVRLGEEVAEFIGRDGRLIGLRTKSGQDIPCEMACVTIGVEPRKSLARRSGIETGKGILVDPTLQTSQPNVFAAGDCAEIRDPHTGRTNVELLWYSARAQGSAVAASIVGVPRPYDFGIFYNSAMFFDVDYISVGAGRYPGDDQEDFSVTDRKGAVRRFVHRNRQVTGITSVASNDRYEDLVRYVRNAWPVDEAVRRLGARRWFGR